MKEADGDFALAAAALDSPEGTLRGFVARDPQLAALWLPDSEKVSTPDEGELMTRAERPGDMHVAPLKGNALGEAVLRADREIMRRGLEGAGIDPAIVRKLGLFEDMAMNTGRFLGAGLDITHRLTLYQGIALFERAEKIKKDYLDDETLPMELRIEWQKCYNEIAELIGKTSDRVLAGTQAAVAMLKKKDENEGGKGEEKVVGFQPLQARK